MRKAQFFYLLRRGLLAGGLNFIKEGLVMASKFTTQGLTFPAQGSAEFNGSSDYIQLDNAFSHTNHTIAAWVYNKDFTTTIFDNRDADNDGIRLIIGGSKTLVYQINSSDAYTSSALNDEQWYFVAGTYDGTTQKLYVDGSLAHSLSTSQTISVGTYNSNIGKSTYENNYFNGNLANVAIWNRALSSDEINSVMWKSVNGLTDSEKNGLQAWYSLDNIDGTNVPDSSGNGNDGTAN